ncbi:YitT family protein [Ureaplasma ceti]|uniref:YitT family protein n=1 Tax=Ureaplasma ceti TaxID=3119530 RepID=A0ABP9UD39_9BACT
MIITSDRPKKRFNIERNFSRYLQNKSVLTGNYNNQHTSVVSTTNYTEEINQAKEKLELLEQEFNETINKTPELITKIKILEDKIVAIKTYLEELNKLHKKSANTTSVKIQNVKYSAKTIRMGAVYKINKLWQKYLLTALIGAVASVIVWLLVQYTGVYSPGVSGIIQGLAKIIKIVLTNAGQTKLAMILYNAIFWGLYFVLNIPLLIFGYFKIGKQFALLTIVYIAFAQLVGLGLGFVNNGHGIFVFGDMSDLSSETSPLYVQGVQLIPWNSGKGIIPSLFIYAVVFALIGGINNSVIYILGSSTGGTDVFGFYYAKVKNKSIGTLLTYFNVASIILGVTLGSFVCWLINSTPEQRTTNAVVEAFFSPNLVASLLSSVLAGLIYNYFFPKNKIVKVQIYSKKAQEVAFFLIERDWQYKILISQSATDSLGGSFTNKSLETVCSYLNLPTLISNIREIDKEGLVTIYSIFGVDGELPTTTYEK